jgi:Mg2+/citrate symporter
MTIQEQLGILIFLTLLNCFIHPTIPASLVFIAATSLCALISYITKVEDKRIEVMQSEIKDMKEKMSSVAVSVGLRK